MRLAVVAVSRDGVELWRETGIEGDYAPAFSALGSPVITGDGTLLFWALDAMDVWWQTGHVFSLLTGSRGVADSAWPGAFGGATRRSRARICAEGDRDGDGVADCAEIHPPPAQGPDLVITGPASGTYRQTVVKAPTHVLDLGITCGVEANRFVQRRALGGPDLPCQDAEGEPTALPARFMAPIFYVGDPVRLTARAVDLQDGDLSGAIQWQSDLDGALGSGSAVIATLREGAHTITAEVLDADANRAKRTHYVRVKRRPAIALDYLDPGDTALVGERVRYHFVTDDAVTEPALSSGPNVNWNPWRDEIEPLSPGFHRVTAAVYDSFWDAASMTFTLTAVGPVSAELDPLFQSSYRSAESVPLSGGYSYPSGIKADQVSLRWYSDLMGYLGEGQTLNVGMTPGSHSITLEVSDDLGQTATASTTIVVTDDPNP